MNRMHQFQTEYVGGPQDKGVPMPKQDAVRKILEGLWIICSARESGAGFECDWSPKNEFCFRVRRKPEDRIFRLREFEGRKTVKYKRLNEDGLDDEIDDDTEHQEIKHDGGPGRGGLDLLGKYTLKDSTVTIYVDSCRKVVERYFGFNSVEGLIEVVLIHELAHLITHRVYELKYTNENDSVHLWEYTAQCGTYAYLNGHCGRKNLEIFERLSPCQPFIYRTWEGLKAVESVHSTNLTAAAVQSVFSALKEPGVEIENQHTQSGYEE